MPFQPSTNLHGFTPRGFRCPMSKVRISNGMMQSTHTRMDFVDSVVVERFDSNLRMSVRLLIPWQKFHSYFLRCQKIGWRTGDVIGVTWKNVCEKNKDGNLSYGPIKTYGPYSMATLFSYWDEDRKVHLPSRITVGCSSATALLFDNVEY